MKKLFKFGVLIFLSLFQLSCGDSYLSPFGKKWQGQFDIRVVNSSNNPVDLINVYMIDTKEQFSKYVPKDTIFVFSFNNIPKLDTSQVKTIKIKDISKIGTGYLFFQYLKNNRKDTLEINNGIGYSSNIVDEGMTFRPNYVELVVLDSATNVFKEFYLHAVPK